MTVTQIERAPVRTLKPFASNARTHSKKQIEQIARSIKRFGFTNPILVDDAFGVIAGHGRLEAAKLIGLEDVPVVRLSHLSEADKRAYILADNRLAEKAGWDKATLALELQGLIDLGYEVELTGFEIAEVDVILGDAADADPQGPGPEDDVPALASAAVTQLGDVWVLGRHRLVCGDARHVGAYQALMDGETADLIFTDPPYNVPISGHVRTQDSHREFVMASGEMSQADFKAFLEATLGQAARVCRDGAIAFVCMDWRHMGEMQAAGERVFGALKNLCVWAKTNAGMGSFYRSQHELVFVYRVGDGPHLNTFELGQHGRYRTNVWSYAGANAFSATRDEDLALHPTVKPLALIADAIKDVSKRNQIVLDPFAGSGSTLIAAETCGRRARVIELDPVYCDVIAKRYQRFSGKPAVLAASSASFEEVASQRLAQNEEAHHG